MSNSSLDYEQVENQTLNKIVGKFIMMKFYADKFIECLLTNISFIITIT